MFFAAAYLSQILCMYQVRVVSMVYFGDFSIQQPTSKYDELILHQLQNNWIPGYALAIGFFMEMIFYCLMGTKVVMEVCCRTKMKTLRTKSIDLRFFIKVDWQFFFR